MKLGKREATVDHRDLLYRSYALPARLPGRFGFGKLYADFGMLGNDRYGDCVFAGAAHETMLWNRISRKISLPFTDDCVLDDYSAVTGFTRADPASDQGTYTRDALKFRQKTGVQDATGARHKIAAYVQLDAGDWRQLMQATYVFGAVGMGFQFPDTAFWQFDHQQAWDVNAAASIVGGHYVPVVGTMASSKRATCVTWGRRQEFTRAFYQEFADEAWAILSLEVLNSAGKGLHGFDLAQLRADLAAL